MSFAVVLDAAAFDLLDSQQATGMRALLRRAIDDGGEVRCSAVTLAEVCRGLARTQHVEAALARRRGGQRIRILPTDERFAKLVGAILHDTASGREHIADAHVIAACTTVDAAIVLTADPRHRHVGRRGARHPNRHSGSRFANLGSHRTALPSSPG